jgi:rsbT co-antagonist protein RsbR
MPELVGTGSAIYKLLSSDGPAFIDEWIKNIRGASHGSGEISDSELREQCTEFLRAFLKAVEDAPSLVPSDSQWKDVRELLAEFSASRAVQGFTPTGTATFVLSFKEPLFRRLPEIVSDAGQLSEEIWNATALLDSLGLYTTEVLLKTREDMIRRSEEDMLELSTPVVKLWNLILALPLIGTLDSARTQVVMDSLLNAIVTTNSKVAIMDITGVPTVDTVVAQHLLKTVTAVRLMGADCIISGIRPQIAQTIVHLGINLTDIHTKASLRDAFALALELTGQQIVRQTVS